VTQVFRAVVSTHWGKQSADTSRWPCLFHLYPTIRLLMEGVLMSLWQLINIITVINVSVTIDICCFCLQCTIIN